MKIEIRSTDRIVDVNGVPARVWEGTSEAGVKVICLVARIAVPADQDQQQFQRELQEHAAPSRAAVDAFPLRMLI